MSSYALGGHCRARHGSSRGAHFPSPLSACATAPRCASPRACPREYAPLVRLSRICTFQLGRRLVEELYVLFLPLYTNTLLVGSWALSCAAYSSRSASGAEHRSAVHPGAGCRAGATDSYFRRVPGRVDCADLFASSPRCRCRPFFRWPPGVWWQAACATVPRCGDRLARHRKLGGALQGESWTFSWRASPFAAFRLRHSAPLRVPARVPAVVCAIGTSFAELYFSVGASIG